MSVLFKFVSNFCSPVRSFSAFARSHFGPTAVIQGFFLNSFRAKSLYSLTFVACIMPLPIVAVLIMPCFMALSVIALNVGYAFETYGRTL
ncbi:hypothetical protein [Campylobacter hyointestinalis]|uniref:hypothetical protein n=1 Tax=Campylobacter hyointestinalis TaxID=198 RepID=UPI0020127473|nr:hypothetical protein [Campylobacter hyointestinalis]